MKRGIICLSLLFLLSACALFPRRTAEISWPEKITYMEAMCELDMAWQGTDYSGPMSLTVEYPGRLQFEVYGPFGDTVVYLKKEGGAFLLVAGNERYTDERYFEEKFGIELDQFMEDITFRGPGESRNPGTPVLRNGYRVLYDLQGTNGRICWEGEEGKICLKFLEARFSKE